MYITLRPKLSKDILGNILNHRFTFVANLDTEEAPVPTLDLFSYDKFTL